MPLFDFGGSGPTLHFASANGYPPAAYLPLIERLTPRFHVIAQRSLPLQPGAHPASLRSWSQLADELIAFLDGLGVGPVVGVGHSLGAVVSLQAALRCPDLFRAVVAIEPVLFHPLKLMIYSVFRALGLADRVHPLIAGTRGRRRDFLSADEMYARYRQATVFSRLDDRALRTYVDAAVRPRADGQGVELIITPEWEVQVYATGPSYLWGQLSRLRVPLLVLRGAETEAFDSGAVTALKRRLPKAAVVELPGAGHLVPLEKPAEVAELIFDFISGQKSDVGGPILSDL